MARGKNKLRKLERVAAKTPMLEAHGSKYHPPSASALAPRDLDFAHHDDLQDWDDDFCDHENLNKANMLRVTELLSDLFSSSFKLAIPSLFRGMVQNLQDQVLKDKITTFVDHGFSPSLIEALAGDQSTKEGIRTQIYLACEDELGDVVLRLSTEDSFDLLCDLAVRHGRDLKTWGPPCACSFSKCLPCLERLVQSIKATPPTPETDIKAIQPNELITWIDQKRKSKEDTKINQAWDEDLSWRTRVTSAWKKMADILWQYANDIDPLQLPRVKAAHDALVKLNGLDLFYTVVTREVAAIETRKDMITQLPDSTRLNLSSQYERMKKENQTIKRQATDTPRDDDWTGADYRKALARAIREQGNQAFAQNAYQEATEQYTRAIGYDATEPIYPLNRAACLVKLKRYSEAERDCTAAILLDPSNHKAYFRRGVSRAGLGSVEEAREDFEQVLKLQKANPQVHEELRKLSEQFLERASKKLPPSDSEPAPTPAPVLETKGKNRASPTPSPAAEPEAEVQNWLKRAREVIVEILFAHYFSLVVQRETGIEIAQHIKLDPFRDICELASQHCNL